MDTQEKQTWPLPDVTEVDKPFWDAVQNQKLVLQYCRECGRLQYLPRPVCLDCFSLNLDWQESKGTGKVYSFSQVYIPVRPGPRIYVQDMGVPIILASIELDDGVRAVSEIVDCKPEDIHIGDRVHVCFRDAPGTNYKLPKFQLIK